mmetsp:Transcript_34586/g.95275  ORF Transcript_34586/g.95275 Transcript_34586/m.95275 type:complete len:201 (+) Transcript_34586:593-1195(+)
MDLAAPVSPSPFESKRDNSEAPPTSSAGGSGALVASRTSAAVFLRRIFEAGNAGSCGFGGSGSLLRRTAGAPAPQVCFWTSVPLPLISFRGRLNKSSSSSAIRLVPDRFGAAFRLAPAFAPRGPPFFLRASTALFATSCSSASCASISSKAFNKAWRSRSHIVSIVVFINSSNSCAFISCCFLISSTFSYVRLHRFMPKR